MTQKLANILSGAILLALTVIAFFWLWTTSRTTDVVRAVPESLKPVEIETVKQDAEDLVRGRQNISDIPIATPLTKMGRDNPFAGL